MLAAALLGLAASVIDGGDFEIPRVTMHRKYRPQFPWSSLHTAVAPYQQVDGSAACSAQRQFLVCKRNRCWVNVRVRTRPRHVYRVRYSVDEQVFDGCVPAYCATLAVSAPKPVKCLPCDKAHGVKIDGDERVADEVIGAQQCEVVPVFKQMQLDFVAQGLDTSITWFPKNVSANPRGNFKLDRVSVFQVCGSDLIPVDETLDGPGREFCPPTAAPTPAPPSQAPTQQPTAQPSTGSPSVPPSTGAPSAAPSAPSATPSAPPSAASTVSPTAPAAAAPLNSGGALPFAAPPSAASSGVPPSASPSGAPSGVPPSGGAPSKNAPPFASAASESVAAIVHSPGAAQPSGASLAAPPIAGSSSSSHRLSGVKLALVCLFVALPVVLAPMVLRRWRTRNREARMLDASTAIDLDEGGPTVEPFSPRQGVAYHVPFRGSASYCSGPPAPPTIDLPHMVPQPPAPPPLPIQEAFCSPGPTTHSADPRPTL